TKKPGRVKRPAFFLRLFRGLVLLDAGKLFWPVFRFDGLHHHWNAVQRLSHKKINEANKS
ncbi:hypothetical protein ACVGXB_00230, partial [Enterobacter intestinihominis]